MTDEVSSDDGGEADGRVMRLERANRRAGVSTDLDAAFDLLRSSRRRYLLYHLDEHGGEPVAFDDVVDAVCAYEAAGTPGEEFPARQPMRTSLGHVHLPRLDEAGVIEYDRRKETIRLDGGPTFGQWLELAAHLELE